MAQLRLQSAGLAAFDEMQTTCCYAKQDKIWVQDPDGIPWELFVTHEDVEPGETPSQVESAACCSDGANAPVPVAKS